MVTWNVWRIASNVEGADPLQPLHYGEGDCLSSDEKPTEGVANGSLLIEMDTGSIYKFDQSAGAWLLTWG